MTNTMRYELAEKHRWCKELTCEKVEFDIPIGENGDCYDRYMCRVQEFRESLRIINQVHRDVPTDKIAANGDVLVFEQDHRGCRPR